MFDYRLGNRSALERIIDQYQVSEAKGPKVIADVLKIGTTEARRLLRGQVPPSRTNELQAWMMKASVPL